MITQQQLDAWKKLAEEATPGPWEVTDDWEPIRYCTPSTITAKESNLYITIATMNYPNEYGNSNFIATAREAVPALIAEVERLQERLSHYERKGFIK